jgi:flagellar motor protein MotB
MKRSSLRIGALRWVFCAIVLSAGCVKKSTYNAVLAERDSLAQVVTEQEKELVALKTDFDRLAEVFAEEITNKELQLQQLADGIEVAIPSDVMYESGSATVTTESQGLEYAKRLADFLRDTDYFISVVGHTDNQQPTRELAKKHPTNWELAGQGRRVR